MTDFSSWFPIQISLTGFRDAKIRYPVDQPPVPSSSLIHQATVTLTDTQIRDIGLGDLAGSPTFVEAPGIGKVLQFVSAFGVLDATGGAYDFLDLGAGWVFMRDVNHPVSTIAPLSGVGDAVVYFEWSPMPSITTAVVGENSFVRRIVTAPTTTAQTNIGIQLTDWFAPGAYTGGHANNTLKITVAYRILDLQSGTYE